MEIFRNNKGALPLMIIIIAVVVLALGGGAFMFFKGKSAHAGSKKKEKVELTSVEMGEFMVTLADTGDLRYLKCDLVLEVEKGKEEKGGGGHGEEGASPEEAKARDIILTTLSSKTVGELVADKTKSKIKEELATALNESIEGMKVHEIYFTSFAMQ